MTQLTRLNKYISETGFCSRREADKLIESGRVRVNNAQPEMGQKVSDLDVITVDGKSLKEKPKRVYIAYNKPVGITCTTERKIRSNIVNAINYPERIFPIGRLDRPSEGLIFLTNEGDIVNKILRAGNNHEKEYVVSVDRPINSRFIERMAGGIPILDTVTKKCHVKKTGDREFTIVLTQGLNRQIRRMCEYLGYEVVTLKRVRIMNVKLDGLRSGQWRHLSEREMHEINSSIASSAKTEEGSLDPNKRPERSLKAELQSSAEKSKPRDKSEFTKKHKPQKNSDRSKERFKTDKPVQKSHRNSKPSPTSKPARRKGGTLSLKK
ncbi:23S rRNA pseudouridine(2604) synthase RluF [Pseudoalteromonas citrea]|uniref:Pseudouridine synthase n=1 Tax=Pseudoalteromonas citrea TaxID=43655 RepID=A0A5S3XRC3_9GAMM|nr:23S rRNA pseudouridine(2604) synthase RluF [Pseudoalteromonas citrea]TMP42504.1 23S rRNA pseudouridine(2604) synthase RluF [Pseudoalteromonas citrea]TMP59317.1 23S rRNA pseudouridine(2604) synthase RluF [Pseudoalteromonas citrea]